MDTQLIDQYAVIGNPIEHSLSPHIHSLFAIQTQQPLIYSKVLAPLDDFVGTLTGLQAHGFRGANVTVPFKRQAFQLATRHTARAVATRTVNTLLLTDHDMLGDNTDGIGLVRDIQQNLCHSLKGLRVLLIGAGGAAQSVLPFLLSQAPARLAISNRSLDKAQTMLSELAQDIELLGFDDIAQQSFDIVINATSSGLSGAALPLPASLFSPAVLAYDMVYGIETAFMALARRQGAQVMDGLGMLVEQAAEAFLLWRGVRPETQPVLVALRAGVAL